MAGEGLPEETQEQVIESCRREICKGADRVKHAPSGSGSLHPVVEGAIDVLSSVVLDRRRIHTVSVPDPKSKCCLCYSMPCRVGRDGVLERMIYPLDIPGVREKMDAFIKKREADIISNI
jgi:malate/lactate dehydrogenase